ncbi:MAG: carboxylating nicotinate-nucleotide diphosphorylase [Candidatus Brocadiaceae bacterium]|jgi:nicotinate-nucleotide pyrophosphorylase (carboxylating)
MDWSDWDWLLDAALAEDAAERDATTGALVDPDLEARAEVRAREPGIVCGLPLAGRLVERFGGEGVFDARTGDGDPVQEGTVLAALRGPAASILAVERTMLNFLQRLSGVATLTARFVREVEGTGARIYDTRKTTPGWRELEKYAVRCGGGRNHRMHLAGAVLIKDNHLALLREDGARAGVEAARRAHPDLTIEVEVDTLEQLESVLPARPDIVLLDNMTPEQVRRAAQLVGERGGGSAPLLEASGGITLENVAAYAEAGADRIAVGALTHSAPALDISLEFSR